MSDSVQPHRRKPTRLLCPWDSPSKNTVVGCHFLLQCMKVKSESEVAQSCLTLRDPMDCSLPGSSVHGILHARVLEWGRHVNPRPFHFNVWQNSLQKKKKKRVLEWGAIAFSAPELLRVYFTCFDAAFLFCVLSPERMCLPVLIVSWSSGAWSSVLLWSLVNYTKFCSFSPSVRSAMNLF